MAAWADSGDSLLWVMMCGHAFFQSHHFAAYCRGTWFSVSPPSEYQELGGENKPEICLVGEVDISHREKKEQF